jgi:hypothetical protein
MAASIDYTRLICNDKSQNSKLGTSDPVTKGELINQRFLYYLHSLVDVCIIVPT